MNTENNIFIITGEARSGKTLLISNLISKINKLGIKATGVYSPARFEGGVKTGIYVIDISSGKKELLASYQPGWDPENLKREWKMDTDVLQWGHKIIRNSVPTSVLIIDEMGFLEFEKNLGWISAFNILEEGNYRIAIVVVRIGLLKQALTKWESAKIIDMDKPSLRKEQTSFLLEQIQAISTK